MSETVISLGSKNYCWISPERILGCCNLTSKSDVYSLGMVIWSIWSQQYPYDSLGQSAIRELVVFGEREDLDKVHPEIKPIIAACWQQDPMERPDASDVVDMVKAVVHRLGSKETSPEAVNDLWAGRNYAATDGTWAFEAEDLKPNIQLETSFLNYAELPKSTHGGFANLSPQHNHHKPYSTFSLSDNVSTSIPPSKELPIYEPSTSKVCSFHEVLPATPTTKACSHQKPTPKTSLLNTGESELKDLRNKPISPNPKSFELYPVGRDPPNEHLKPKPPVTIDQALDHHNSGHRQRAFDAFRTLANCNDPKAHYYLGYYYYWGQDDVCEKDWDKALYHLEIASQANDSDALDHLGIYYSDDQNPNKNLVKAFELYRRSAELGNKKGYYHLGVCYAKGRGTPKNKELALANVREAANRGHTLAIEQLSRTRLR